MSMARERFVQRVLGAYAAAQSQELLGVAGNGSLDDEAARLLRNGLTVAAFAAFEGFIRERTREVVSYLGQQSIPFSSFPEALRNAPKVHGVPALNALMKRGGADAVIENAIQELGNAWSRMGTGGAWRLPHISLMWTGSNLTAADTLRILALFGCASAWPDISGVSRGASFRVLPTSNLFNEISQRRHSAAHDSEFDADITLLRATPDGLLGLGFGFDALLSSAARRLAAGLDVSKGRAAVHLTTIEEQTAGEWQELEGYRDDSQNAPGVRADLSTDWQAALADCRSRTFGPESVILVRELVGTTRQVVTWATPGV